MSGSVRMGFVPRAAACGGRKRGWKLPAAGGRDPVVDSRRGLAGTCPCRLPARKVRGVIAEVRGVAAAFGYRVHGRGTRQSPGKLKVLRPHQRQAVCGIVVNEAPGGLALRLPRERRRWLRAVEHRMRTGGVATLTPAELAGWRAYEAMVEGPRREPAGVQHWGLAPAPACAWRAGGRPLSRRRRTRSATRLLFSPVSPLLARLLRDPRTPRPGSAASRRSLSVRPFASAQA